MRILISIFQEAERSMKRIMSVPSYTVLFLLCLGGFSAQAATIYVRTTGNDATSCTQARNASTPRKTITAGIACLSGGDTLIVGGGNYDEAYEGSIPSGLSASQPTTIRNAPGERVVMNPVTARNIENRVFTAVSNFLVIDGINIDAAFNIGFGLAVGGRGNIYRNFSITGAYGQAVSGVPENGTFANVEIHHNGQYDRPGNPYYPYRGYHHGMYLGGTEDTGTNYNILIDGCYIHDQDDGHGLQLYVGGVTVRNSIIANNYGNGIDMLGSNSLAYNNIFVNNGQHDGAVGIFITGGGAKVYNNTLYTASPNSSQSGFDSRSTSSTIRNNILLNVSTYASQYITMENGGGTISNNLCTVSAPGCAIVEPTLSRIIANAASGNFHLIANSPAIGAGMAVPEVTVDKDGTPRTGSVDVGAYEYAAQGPVLPAPKNLRATVQ